VVDGDRITETKIINKLLMTKTIRSYCFRHERRWELSYRIYTLVRLRRVFFIFTDLSDVNSLRLTFCMKFLVLQFRTRSCMFFVFKLQICNICISYDYYSHFSFQWRRKATNRWNDVLQTTAEFHSHLSLYCILVVS